MSTADLFEDFLAALRNRDPFSFARYGDGEWHCVLGDPGQNCDGHRYDRKLGSALRQILRYRPDYFVGMQPLSADRMGDRIDQWLKTNSVKINWVNADVLHEASEAGRLGEMLDAIGTMRIVVVGPAYLKGIKRLASADFVEVPLDNAWDDRRHVMDDTLFQIVKKPAPVCAMFSCGPMAKVLVDECHRCFGKDSFFIDTGSVFDPYAGHCTRRYHEKVMAAL